MKNSLPGALVLGFVSLAWGDESLRAQPVRSPTELPPASEPPPPSQAEAPWSFAALHPPRSPARQFNSTGAPKDLADKQCQLKQLQQEIDSLKRQIEKT